MAAGDRKYSGCVNRLLKDRAFDVLTRAKELEARGKKIIHLEIGEPDFDTPANIQEAAIKAIKDGHTRYCPAAGLPQLREAISERIGASRVVDVAPDEVVVAPGAKPLIFFGILACVEPGDEAICPNPGFPVFESVINFAGARPVALPLRAERDFAFDPDELQSLITDRTKLIVINSPHNPTGSVLPAETLERIAEAALKRDLMVISDEVYSNLVYQGGHKSIISIPGMKERTLLIDGFSKTYAMTGWRLGYGVMPRRLARHIEDLMVNSNSCTSPFVQMAGLEALTGPQDESLRMALEFKKRRDVMVGGLNEIAGFKCSMPGGAFYAFPDVSGTGISCEGLADYLLEEAGVACLAGTAFGAFGDGHLRFTYSNSAENLQEAIGRIKGALKGLSRTTGACPGGWAEPACPT